MIRDLLKWVAPGVVTVVGTTVAALAMATPVMVDTLDQQSRAALHHAGADWAQISLSGRHVHLTGTTASDVARDEAIASLAAVSGLADIDDTVTIAPLASPFRINVAVEDGAISLFGDVANESQRQEISSLPGIAAADLEIRAGQPDPALWREGLNFALAQASLVDSGYFELSDLTMSAALRASSQKALGQLQMALADAPAGLSVGEIAVEPVRITPYTWRAEFDGNRIAISGHVPEEKIADRLRMADVSGIPVATGLSLASGAPEGFAEHTRLLVEQLAKLEQGEARITDGVSLLVGVPPSIAVAQAVTEALSGTDSIVQLSPPRVSDYWISISRQPGGTLVFDGFVPDETTRSDFATLAGADVSFLKFGAGAPAYYRQAVDFGVDILSHVSEGRFALSGGVISLSGIALSPTDYRTILDRVAADAPEGVTIAGLAVEAPPAASYVFAARRDAAGGVTLDGMLPNPDAEARILAAAGAGAQSDVTFASGQAPDFLETAEQALDFLPWLRSGAVRFDGTGWTIEGEPASVIDKASIEAEFAVRRLSQAGWTLALSAPADVPGLADPYLWSAERLPDGSFLFAGNVPAQALKDYFKVHVGTRVADTSRIARGAPEGFAAAARVAVDALLLLDEGRAAFDGSDWTLSGAARDAETRDQALVAATSLALAGPQAISVPPAAASDPYTWAATKTPQGVELRGMVPAESLQRFLAVRAGETVDDRTEVRADAPEGFASEVLEAMDVLALLTEGDVSFDGANWSATGTSIDPDAEAAASALLGASAPRWRLAIEDIRVETAQAAGDPPAASEPAAPATPAAPPVPVEAPIASPPRSAPSTPAGLAQCQARLAELSAHNAILFQSGAAIIAASAAAELDAFAQALMLCPDGVVEVEGHTDSDGDDQRNMALSVARAEAVVNALIERGVSPDRLYAIGYGETQPIADNGTAEGKSRNRRIVVSVRSADSRD